MRQKFDKFCLCMDITSLHEWQGTPVGVVRVESELVKSLLPRTDITVLFARYLSEKHSFVQVEREYVEKIVSGSHEEEPKQPAKRIIETSRKPAGAQLPSARKALLKKWKLEFKKWLLERYSVELQDELQKLLTLVMHLIRTFVGLSRHLVRAMVHHLTGRSLKARWKARHEKPVKSVDDSFLAAVDVYFSCGFDWFSDKIDVLNEKKNLYKFHLHTACHDLIPVRAPQLVGMGVRDFYAQYFRKLLQVSDHITCFSEATRLDLVEFARDNGFKTPDLSVSHHGSPVPTVVQRPQAAALAALHGKPFCLTVGTLEPRKNHELLIWIWERFIEEGMKDIPPLVIIGKRGWEIERVARRLEKNLLLRSHLIWLQEVTDYDLAWAYQNCSLFLFPSLYEGWGLPLSEALAYGRPCISSNSSSLPEASAGRATLLDPKDFVAWYKTIKAFFKDPEARPVAAQNARSWDESLCDLLKPWIGSRELPS